MADEKRIEAIKAAITKHVQGGGKLLQGGWGIDYADTPLGPWFVENEARGCCGLSCVVLGQRGGGMALDAAAELLGVPNNWTFGFTLGFDGPRSAPSTRTAEQQDGFRAGVAIYHWAVEQGYLKEMK